MWFSSHWMFLVRFRDGIQESYPILEKSILIEAFDHGEALVKAELMVKQEQAEFTGTYHWGGGRPADLEFIGVRKAIIISTEDGGSEVKLADGQDLTQWEYHVQSEEDARTLVNGGRASVELIK